MDRKQKPLPRYWEEGHLSFAGASCLGVYNTGAALAFREFAPHIAARKTLGASSGVFTAVLLATGMSLHHGISCIAKLVVRCRSRALRAFSPGLNIWGVLRADLEKCLPNDAHLKSHDKAFFSLTTVATLSNKLLSEFESRDELIEAILAALFIPFIIGIVPPKVRGVRYIDGGFTGNFVTLDENTITVSPFFGLGCVRPKSTSFYLLDTMFNPVNIMRLLKSFFPPPPKELEGLSLDGYKDALRFIRDHDLYACTNCARLPSRPRRGDCQECEALLKLSYKATINPSYLEPLREAQKAEDALINANPLQYTLVMKILYVLAALAFLPINATIATAVSACRSLYSSYGKTNVNQFYVVPMKKAQRTVDDFIQRNTFMRIVLSFLSLAFLSTCVTLMTTSAMRSVMY